MWVKVCGLTRVVDVEAALEAGADAIGFVLADSPRRLRLEEARTLAEVARGRALSVAVVVDPSPSDLARLAGFDAVQVHGTLPAVPPGLRLLRAGSPEDVAGADGADWILVDGSRGRGTAADWSGLVERVWPAPLVLAGGLHPGNVAEAVEAVRPFGVDVSSGVEVEPGVKGPVLVESFVAAAKAVRR